jgi:regulator of sigma E protease
MDLVYFIVLIGVLIFVHELGHFVWAKFFGVKVLEFTLGFGSKIIKWKRAGTEYAIAAIPLGGYVRMLGENPHDIVPEKDRDHTFYAQPLWRRVIIVFAGPMMNLVFPVMLFFVVFLGDTHMAPAIVGTVLPRLPADGRLVPGDQILSVDGDEVSTFDEVQRAVAERAGETLHFEVQRGEEKLTVTVTPELTHVSRELDRQDEMAWIGIMPIFASSVIGISNAAGPAAAAGLQTFDLVIRAGDRPATKWTDLVTALDGNRGALTPITYLHPTRVSNALGGLVELEVYEPHVATVTPEPGRASGIERAGIESAELYVGQVTQGSIEHRLGLLPGDRLEQLDAEPIRLYANFLDSMRDGQSHTLVWRRADRTMSRQITLPLGERDESGEVADRYYVRNWIAPASVENPHRITYAIREAIHRTWEVVDVTLLSILRLFQGRLSVKTIGGPLMIFEVVGVAAHEGAFNYLNLMAFLSINVGLINLLPIPLLDGGHLMFFAIESITRKPLPKRIREYASVVGLTVLVLLVVLAFANDLTREWPAIVAALRGA